jgi:hypothetical protein
MGMMPPAIEGSLPVLAGYLGPRNTLWATDYVHPGGFFPGATQMIREWFEPMSSKARHPMSAGGAINSSSRPGFPRQRNPLGFVEPLS